MHRSILIALAAGVILLAFAMFPPMLPGSTTMSLSGSALAQKTPTTNATTIDSTKSRTFRAEDPGKKKKKDKASAKTGKKDEAKKRMGGGGGGGPSK